MRRLFFFGVVSLALISCDAPLGSFEPNSYRVEGTKLFMDGEISPRSPAGFEAVIDDHPQVDTVVLMDMPGSVDEDAVHALGYFIRDVGLKTHLTPQSEIYSGAVDLFLAGFERTMTCCAVIGVHDWTDDVRTGSSFPAQSWQHDANVAYFETMLGDDAFYWFTLQAASPDEIHIMTNAEIKRFGLLTQ
ncbi:MAG: hypothetical protein ABJL67_16515 [Sulfitobacter sp.]